MDNITLPRWYIDKNISTFNYILLGTNYYKQRVPTKIDVVRSTDKAVYGETYILTKSGWEYIGCLWTPKKLIKVGEKE